ncbi:MAG: PHB depolymerase family esterase [Acidimicrobiales bacterium]
MRRTASRRPREHHLPAGRPGAGDVGSSARCPAVEPTGTVTHASLTMPDGAERTYRLYLPSTFDPEVPTPLLVALHGGLGWGDQFAETNHVEGLAEANGFVVVHPDGTRIRPRLRRAVGGGYCCGPAAADQVDDVAFVAAVLDDVGQKIAHRPEPDLRHGATPTAGSPGYRLACELGDRIVGIGVVGASLGVDTCTPRHRCR